MPGTSTLKTEAQPASALTCIHAHSKVLSRWANYVWEGARQVARREEPLARTHKCPPPALAGPAGRKLAEGMGKRSRARGEGEGDRVSLFQHLLSTSPLLLSLSHAFPSTHHVDGVQCRVSVVEEHQCQEVLDQLDVLRTWHAFQAPQTRATLAAVASLSFRRRTQVSGTPRTRMTRPR